MLLFFWWGEGVVVTHCIDNSVQVRIFLRGQHHAHSPPKPYGMDAPTERLPPKRVNELCIPGSVRGVQFEGSQEELLAIEGTALSPDLFL